MLWRVTSIFLLVQQAVWLLVVLPGHQRGAVTMAGYKGSACCAEPVAPPPPPTHSCCHTPAATTTSSACDTDPDKKHAPTGDRTAHCAVCFVAARIVVAAPPDLAPRPTGVTAILPPAAAHPTPFFSVERPFDPTGPPSHA